MFIPFQPTFALVGVRDFFLSVCMGFVSCSKSWGCIGLIQGFGAAHTRRMRAGVSLLGVSQPPKDTGLLGPPRGLGRSSGGKEGTRSGSLENLLVGRNGMS